MRKLIAALAIMLAAIPFKAFAGFVSWEDGMTVAPGENLEESVTKNSENELCSAVVLDGALYNETGGGFKFGKLSAGRHCAYIVTAYSDGTFEKNNHINFTAAKSITDNCEDFENYSKSASAWIMNSLAKRSVPAATNNPLYGKAMRIKWVAGQNPTLMCRSLTIPADADVTAEADIMITDAGVKADVFCTGIRENGSFDSASAVTPASLAECKIGNAKITVGQWTHLRYEFNIGKRSYKLYAGSELAADGSFPDSIRFNELRFNVSATGSGYMYIDNATVKHLSTDIGDCIKNAFFYNEDGSKENDMCSVSPSMRRLSLEFSGTGNIKNTDIAVFHNGSPIYNFDCAVTDAKHADVIFPNGLEPGSYKLDAGGKYQLTFAVPGENRETLYYDGSGLYSDIRGKSGQITACVQKCDSGGSVSPITAVYAQNGTLQSISHNATAEVHENEILKIFFWSSATDMKPSAPSETAHAPKRITIPRTNSLFEQISDGVTETGPEFLHDSTGFAQYFKKTVCFMKNSRNFWFFGHKLKLHDDVRFENGKIYLSVRDLEALTGAASGSDDDYLPAAEFLGDKTDMQASENGYMLLLSENGEFLQEDKSLALGSYLAAQRPNADELAANNAKAHPKIYADSNQFGEMLEKSVSDAEFKKLSDSIISDANWDINYFNTNILNKSSLSEKEKISQTMELVWSKHILEAYWAYRKTGLAKYSNYALKIGEYLSSDEADWKEKARYNDNGTKTAGSNFLMTSGTMITASYIYDLFYDELPDSLRQSLLTVIYERGVKSGYDFLSGKDRENPWARRTDNWNLISAGGVAVGAATVMNELAAADRDICAKALEAAIRSLEYGMTSFMPDGGDMEGAAYWDYEMFWGVNQFLECMDSVYGSDFGFSEVPGFLETGYFMYDMRRSQSGTYFAFHDYNPNNWMRLYPIMWFAAKTGDKGLYDAHEIYGSKGAMTLKPYSYFTEKCNIGLKNDKIYSRAGVAVSSGDNAKLFIHAGNNNLPHGQLDMGTFAYDYGGVNFASDAGAGRYSDGDYFGSERYDLYVNRAEAHNVYVVNPDADGGQVLDSVSQIVQLACNDNEACYKINMTAAYADDVYSAVRTFRLTDKRDVLCIQDEIVPVADSSFKWFWNTEQDVEITDNKTACLTEKNGGQKLYLHFAANIDFSLEVHDTVPLETSTRSQPTEALPNRGLPKRSMKKITASFSAEKMQKVYFTVWADNNPGGEYGILPDIGQ